MSHPLAKGDRVIVSRKLRGGEPISAAGQITGESRDKQCWVVHLDALKYPITINKGYVEAAPPDVWRDPVLPPGVVIVVPNAAWVPLIDLDAGGGP